MLLASGAVGLWFSYHENQDHLVALRDEKAQGLENRIEQYIQDIEHRIGWTALPRVDAAGADPLESRRIEYLKPPRQAPAITEVAWIDAAGLEQLRVSRLAMDAVGGAADVSKEARFVKAMAGRRAAGCGQDRRRLVAGSSSTGADFSGHAQPNPAPPQSEKGRLNFLSSILKSSILERSFDYVDATMPCGRLNTAAVPRQARSSSSPPELPC